jgi:hypothetical protein
MKTKQMTTKLLLCLLAVVGGCAQAEPQTGDEPLGLPMAGSTALTSLPLTAAESCTVHLRDFQVKNYSWKVNAEARVCYTNNTLSFATVKWKAPFPVGFSATVKRSSSPGSKNTVVSKALSGSGPSGTLNFGGWSVARNLSPTLLLSANRGGQVGSVTILPEVGP